MEILELFRSALTAIRANKTRSVLTTLGIIIGVASVILLVSIGNGLEAFVTKQFQDLGSNIILIVPGKVSLQSGPGRPVSTASKFTFDDARNIERLGDPITAVSTQTFRPATVKYRNKTSDTSLVGIDEKYTTLRNIHTQKGQFITKSMVERAQAVAVIGPTIVKNLFSGGDPIGAQIEVSGHKLTVIGETESKGGGGFGSNSDQDSIIFVPVTTTIKITGDKAPGTLIVESTSPDTTAAAADKVKRYFYKRNLTDDDFTALEPKEILATINTFLGAITGALSGIAAISLVVGGIGIANIMLVSVTERTREIGLRKALGATRRDILLQFLIEAMVLSAIGGMIGIGIGAGFSAILHQFIQTAVSWQSVVLAFGISALVGIVSGLAPAIRASRLNPIEALRYE